MRFFTLILLALLFSCASSKYNCIDILDTKKQKVPLKYRIGKRSDKSQTNYSKEIFGSSIPEGPVLASIGKTELVVPSDLRKREIKLLIEEVSMSAASKEPLRFKREHSVKPETSAYTEELDLKVDQDSTRQDEEFKKAKTLGFISFGATLGGIASAPFTPFLFFPLIITGLVTGIISLKKYKKTGRKKLKVFPILGVVLSGLWLVLLIIAIGILIRGGLDFTF